jgi:hypothetical protein
METDALMHQMSTRGKSDVSADAFEVDGFVSIGNTQQSVGSGADINVEGAVAPVTFIH